MTINPDWETLRALADEGNEKALDRLADLAEQRGDLEALRDLLDEGSMHAGELLTRRAVQRNDLRDGTAPTSVDPRGGVGQAAVAAW
ncbi:MAG: hypothetical protein H0X35_07110 [Pseudonocardiales bacterium]|nr:hypothetical protein [Pseudonocardiales bacterium]